MPSVTALVLAAGGSTRFGSPKQLYEIEGEPLVRRAARLAGEAGCRPVIVILGAAAEACRRALTSESVEIVEHPGWREGMGSSMAAGARALLAHPTKTAGVLILLCDQVALTAESLRLLVGAWELDPAGARVSAFADVTGPPVIIPAAWLPDLAALTGDQGARQVLARHAGSVQRHPFPEAAVDLDVPPGTVASSAGSHE